MRESSEIERLTRTIHVLEARLREAEARAEALRDVLVLLKKNFNVENLEEI